VAEAADTTAASVTTVAAVANPAVASQAGKLAAVRALATCGGTRDVQPPEDMRHPTRFGIAAVSSDPAVAAHAGAVVGDVVLTVGLTVVIGVIGAAVRYAYLRSRQRRPQHSLLDAQSALAGKAPGVPSDDDDASDVSVIAALAYVRFPGTAVFVIEYFTGFVVASTVVVAAKAPFSAATALVVFTGFMFALMPIGVCAWLFKTRFRRGFVCKPNPPSVKAQATAGSGRRLLRWLFRPTWEWYPRAMEAETEPAAVSAMDRDGVDALLLTGGRTTAIQPLADPATLRRYHRHFGLAFDGYADRAPWFLLVEALVLNVGTSVALALANVTQCRAAAWVALAAYGMHLVLLAVLRPYTMRAEAIGQTLSVVFQAVSVVIAAVDQSGSDDAGEDTSLADPRERSLRAMAEDLATASAFVVSMFALLDIGQSVYLQIRRQRAARRAAAAARAAAEDALLAVPMRDIEPEPFEEAAPAEVAPPRDPTPPPPPPPPPPKPKPTGPSDVEIERARREAAAAATEAERAAKFAHWQRLRDQADRLVSELYASTPAGAAGGNSLLATMGTGGSNGGSLLSGYGAPPPMPRRATAAGARNHKDDDDEWFGGGDSAAPAAACPVPTRPATQVSRIMQPGADDNDHPDHPEGDSDALLDDLLAGDVVPAPPRPNLDEFLD